MNGYVNAALGGGGLLLDFFQWLDSNRRNQQYRNEALNFTQGSLDQFGSPNTTQEFLTSGIFDDQPSALFNPNDMDLAIQGMKTNKGYSLDEAYNEFESQLGSGLDDSRRNLEDGLFGLRGIRTEGVDTLDRNRIELGSTFGLLNLDDPEARYREALTFGDEAASANQDAALRSEIDNSFGEAARLGVDPFEAGAFGDSSRRMADRRFDDLFQSRAAAAGERNRIQEFNVGAREARLGEEMATNRNIDTAIQALFDQEMAGASGLYGQRMSTDADLRSGMTGLLFDRQSDIEGLFVPQIAGLETELGRLTQQGQIAEADRLLGNTTLAQQMSQDDFQNFLQLLEQHLAATTYDPTMLYPFQSNVQALPFMDS